MKDFLHNNRNQVTNYNNVFPTQQINRQQNKQTTKQTTNKPVASFNNISCSLAKSISRLISFKDSSAANSSLSKVGISSLPTLLDGSFFASKCFFGFESTAKYILAAISSIIHMKT